jgi:fatty-acyl-CoA synthase
MSDWNYGDVWEIVAELQPDATAVTQGERNVTWGEFGRGADGIARYLLDLGVVQQDKVALYLYNCPEYLQSLFATVKVGLVPINTNYRYADDELTYLWENADAVAVVFHGAFADRIERIKDRVPKVKGWLWVDDGSGPCPDWATPYAEAALGGDPDQTTAAPWGRSGDDLLMLYTGGTTGMPKGTLWRQADIFDAVLNLFSPAGGALSLSVAEHAAAVLDNPTTTLLPLPPFMHGAAQWMALGGLIGGATVVIQDTVDRLDPVDVWHTVAREKVAAMLFVGDAFARPLCDELERPGAAYDTSSLTFIATGGAITSPGAKQRLLGLLPQVLLADSAGSSETGSQLSQLSVAGSHSSSGTFEVVPGTCVVADDLGTVLEPGHEGIGWLAREGTIPLGYLGDEEKTRRTFPVIDGRRMVVPGDRARLLADGRVELLGRESVTINTGGEKVFAEEVEQAILRHPDVDDVLVVGRPSDRWGHEVVAVVQLRAGATVSDHDILDAAATHIASYKVPKDLVRVDRVGRSPSGKPDYGWARTVVSSASL